MIITQEKKIAKEIDDVGEALVGLVEGIAQKKSLSELVGEELPKLMAAVDGAGQIPAEVAADLKASAGTMGYHMGGVLAAILPKPAAPSA
jgi:hypothetical protein